MFLSSIMPGCALFTFGQGGRSIQDNVAYLSELPLYIKVRNLDDPGALPVLVA